MHIPSYDDLEGAIPDVEPGDLLAVDRLFSSPGGIALDRDGSEAASSVARGGSDVAPRSLAAAPGASAGVRQRAPASRRSPDSGPSPLFACLYSPHARDAAVAIAKDFSPRYQRYGVDSAVVDVSGLGRLLGDAAAIGAELARAASMADPRVTIRGPRTDHAANDRPSGPRSTSRYGIRIEPRPLEQTIDDPTGHGSRTTTPGPRTTDHGLRAIRVAVAPTQIAALLLARSGTAPVVTTTEVASALAGVPIEALRQLLGAGAWLSCRACEGTFDTLARWGVRTLGEFAALPAGDLSARLGQAGVWLQALACGLDPRPLVPEPDARRFVERLELEWPIDGFEPLSFVLARLLDPLTAALERADRAAAVLRLDLRLTDRTTHRRVLQLPAAIRDARVFRTLLVLDLEAHPPPAAIDVVTIEIDPAPARVLQYSLLEPATASAETLAMLMARLGALVGDTRCGTPWLLDTHRPDAFEMRPFAPDDRRVVCARPGDQEAGAALCLRRFRPPVAIRVAVERGRPVHVAIDRRGMPGGRVAQGAGPWRTSGAWWGAPGAAWNRDEWDVTFTDGTTARVFRDRATERWFMEGVVD